MMQIFPGGKRCGWRASALLSALLAVAVSPGAAAQTPPGKGAAAAGAARGKDQAAAGAKKDKPEVNPDDEFPVPPDEPVVHKSFSPGEIQRACRKYEGLLIAYYGDIFKVEGCRRRPVLDNKTVYNLQRDGRKVQDVDGDTIAAIPEGEPVDEATSLKNARTCAQLEGHYVTFSNTDVYYVDHCRRRIFPDWATYINHRERHGDTRGEILSLSWVEFDRLAPGEPIASIVDDIFKKLLTGEAGVEVIPINEACAGVDGRITSYYSRVYLIERCHKREIIDPDLYLKRYGFNAKIIELRSEQWLSLPDGRPVEERSVRSPDKGTGPKRQ